MDQEALENRLRKLAQEMPYPPTPDIVRAVQMRLDAGTSPRIKFRPVAVAALIVLLMAAALFAVPSVRAEIVRFIQIGVVRIFFAEPTQAPDLLQSVVPATATMKVTPDAGSTPAFRPLLLDLAGETSLEEAQQKTDFPIRLPTYPPDLGEPELVFYQQDGPMVILAWLDPLQPERVRMSLYQIGPDSVLVKKMQPELQEIQVNEQYAAWTDGPYLLEITGGAYREIRLVQGHTLIWEEDGITYRLETDLPLEEAIRIAESLE